MTSMIEANRDAARVEHEVVEEAQRMIAQEQTSVTDEGEMAELLREHLKDEKAIRFVQEYHRFASIIDDVTDKDREVGFLECSDLWMIAFRSLPSNDFFRAFTTQLVPLLVAALDGWQVATMLENEARAFGNPQDPMLHTSFELRHALHNIAPLCVELLHGPDARMAFSLEWAKLTRRNCGTFAEYVAKVTAENRPMKGRD